MAVYLLHWPSAKGPARHYLGWTGRTVRERLKEHVDGYGSKYTSRLNKSLKAKPKLAYVWPGGTEKLEKRLKLEYKTGHKELCPICCGEWEQWPHDY